MLANAKHPREALEFITWMTTSKEGIDAMIKYCGIGWSPAVDYIGAQREKPSKWFSGQNYNEDVFVPASKEQNIDWSWSPVTQSAFTSLQNQFRRKITSGLKLSDAVELAQREIVQSFKDKGLSVRTAR